MRKIAETAVVAGIQVKLYKSSEWDEYEVRPYVQGKLVPEWVYYTSDLVDGRNSMVKLHADCLQNRVTETVVDGVTQVEAPSTAAIESTIEPETESAPASTACVA